MGIASRGQALPNRYRAEQSFPPRQQVQVWRQGKAWRLHGVAIGSDSVTGVPFLAPLPCDSCRIAIPRAAVDSLRLGNPSAGFWRSAGLGMGLLFALAAVSCAMARSCNYTD